MKKIYSIYIKRFLDIVISIIILPLVLIIGVPIAILIFLEDKGPIFYNGERLGKNGKIFKMHKFRTMKVNSEDIRNKDGSTFNGENDPRLTKIGKFLRKTSIDELPQIINVIKGDMSLIGPRPDLPEHIKLYTKKEKEKLKVLPGITGYNQAYYRNSITWKKRLKNDVYYVEKMSFLLDLKILFNTVVMVARKDGVYIEKKWILWIRMGYQLF